VRTKDGNANDYGDLPMFDGRHYDHKKDAVRLTKQMAIIYRALLVQSSPEGEWLTLEEINRLFIEPLPLPSISAQLRNMRKKKFGGLNVKGRYRTGTRIFEYKYFQGEYRDE
jgi:hypothetical protein